MKTEKISPSLIMKTLDFAYEKALNGVAGLDSAQEMADNYIAKGGTKVEMVNSLIRWQNTKACTSGFLTGLPGIIVMPVTIPANIASVLYVQVRMIAAIAYIGGHDIKDDKVKSLVYACVAGNGAKDILKDIGIVVGQKIATTTVRNISAKTITAINQKVGFRLLTKFGEKGAVNLGKAIPLIGGIIGGSFDLIATNTIGNIARNTFIGQE
ncbi:EcsC family protein [Flavobacterium sp. IB48]|uniref:EcsC family protein n=1 Tax=Flavobacterium sp. IB48 TaxID=2779375 RepID=UPI0018E75397|nr:EcsC family protein [Flavobacterium sp. IB48]MBJ2124847.1 EcsC family protein [Flavobacterium sp. IB48]